MQQAPYPDYINWAQVKSRQAKEASHVGDIAGGIGEYKIANACYHLSEILQNEVKELLHEEATKAHGA